MILVGVQAYPVTAAAAPRHLASRQSLLQLHGVHLLNLQFARDPAAVDLDGFETLPVLERDSRMVTGAEGKRKPLVGEICAVLAGEARRRGCEYFCFANSDIIVTQRAIDVIGDGGLDGYAFSRMDVDPGTGADLGINLGGVDVIAAKPAWWLAHRTRFRDFILGEAGWDQLYTSILLRHADAVLFNVQPFVRHIEHEMAWQHSGAFADYNGWLGSLDSPYFTLWCEYHARREEWAQRGGSEEEHIAIQRAVFTRPWRLSTRVLQPVRKARAWLRYHAAR